MWKLTALAVLGFVLAITAEVIGHVGLGVIGGGLLGMGMTALFIARDLRVGR